MRFFTVVGVLVLCVASCALGGDNQSQQALPKQERFSTDLADKSLDPCSDFFQYSCSKWVKANPIPADQPEWGTFNALGIWNVAAVRDTLESAANAKNRGEVEQKVGDYYSSCMDEAAINKAGIAPLKPV